MSRFVMIAGVMASVSVAVFHTVGRGHIELPFPGWGRSSTQSSTKSPAPSLSDLRPMPELKTIGAGPQERYSRINVEFVASRGEIIAYLRNTPVLSSEDFAAFRYGINAATPNQIPEQKFSVKKTPDLLELPRDTRFLTIQVQFKDGTMSAIRRFDVPADVLKR